MLYHIFDFISKGMHKFASDYVWIIRRDCSEMNLITYTLSHNYVSQSYFEIIKRICRTDDNFLLSVSPLHAPAIYEPKIIIISSLVC